MLRDFIYVYKRASRRVMTLHCKDQAVTGLKACEERCVVSHDPVEHARQVDCKIEIQHQASYIPDWPLTSVWSGAPGPGASVQTSSWADDAKDAGPPFHSPHCPWTSI
jgi:hypothetical protein